MRSTTTGVDRLRAALAAALGIALIGSSTGAGAESSSEKAGAASKPAAASARVLANQILDRWQPVAEAAGAAWPAWREMFETQLGMMDVSILQGIDALNVAETSNAKTSYAQFAEAVRNAQMQSYVRGNSGKGQMKLGSATTDQVFIPIVPCRIVDTRNVGGAIAAGTTRNYWFWSDNGGFSWSTQGGAPFPGGTGAGTTCPGTVNPNGGAPSAAVVTVTAVSLAQGGNWVLWGGASPIPTTSALNWTAGGVVANTTVIPAGGRSGAGPGGAIRDFAVFYNGTPGGSAHFIADVVGYFVENQATALECNTLEDSTSVPANSDGDTTSPACATGYRTTGVSCHWLGSANNGYLFTTVLNLDGVTTRCRAHNSTGSAQSLFARNRCCRIPGL